MQNVQIHTNTHAHTPITACVREKRLRENSMPMTDPVLDDDTQTEQASISTAAAKEDLACRGVPGLIMLLFSSQLCFDQKGVTSKTLGLHVTLLAGSCCPLMIADSTRAENSF